jgi:hypothetical protein
VPDEATTVRDDPPEPAWPLLVVFALPLRDPLPIPHHSIFKRDYEDIDELKGVRLRATRESPDYPARAAGKRFVSLRIWQLKRSPDRSDRDLVDGAMTVLGAAGAGDVTARPGEDYPEPDQAAYRTIVEAVTIVRGAGDLTDEPGRPGALSLCIATLADQIRAYRVASGMRISELTYERICPVVPYFWRTLQSTEAADGPYLMVLDHANVQTPDPETMTGEAVDAGMQILGRLVAGDPLILYAERRLEAEIALYRDGQYAEAAIQAAIAAEVLLSSVLAMLVWEETLEAPDLREAAAVLAQPLVRRVKTGFHGRLGSSWQINTPGPVASWHSMTAGLRNRVVHGGFRPSRQEAVQSLSAVRDLETFVCDRLAANRSTYPRTTLSMLGRAGLDARGRWQDDIFAESRIGPVDECQRRFARWRQQVLAEGESLD